MLLEVLIYFVIAAAVVAMLYLVLGKQVGEAPQTDTGEIISLRSGESDVRENVMRSRHFAGPAGTGLSEIEAAEASFVPDTFLEGAKAAYSLILESYADGDVDTLRSLLSEPMYEAYEAAIKEREAQNLTQTTDMARLISTKFSAASLEGKTASISLVYEAEIAAALLNEAGDVVQGDSDTLAHVKETWTFARTIKSNTPEWLLVSVEEAGEDTLGSALDFKPSDKSK